MTAAAAWQATAIRQHVEDFLYAEAALLDAWRLDDWLRLFDEDAIILDKLASTSVRFAADKGPALEMSWDGFRQLGIWSKPGGAPFLCIEPWYGFASPVDFDGEFSDKPGLMHIPPGEARAFRYTIGVR